MEVIEGVLQSKNASSKGPIKFENYGEWVYFLSLFDPLTVAKLIIQI